MPVAASPPRDLVPIATRAAFASSSPSTPGPRKSHGTLSLGPLPAALLDPGVFLPPRRPLPPAMRQSQATSRPRSPTPTSSLRLLPGVGARFARAGTSTHSCSHARRTPFVISRTVRALARWMPCRNPCARAARGLPRSGSAPRPRPPTAAAGVRAGVAEAWRCHAHQTALPCTPPTPSLRATPPHSVPLGLLTRTFFPASPASLAQPS